MQYTTTQKYLILLGVLMILVGFFLPNFENSSEDFIGTNGNSKSIVTVDQREKECLKSILWFEARSQSELGIKAVLSVVENRKQHPAYPGSYCKIKNQAWQFSYVKERESQGKPLEAPMMHSNPLDKAKYQLINDLATEALTGGFTSLLPANVLHYAHKTVQNKWTRKKKVYAEIDSHKFYISHNGI